MNRPISAATIRNGTVRVEAFINSEDAKTAVEQIGRQIGRGGTVNFHAGSLATAARLIGMTSLGDVLVVELGSEDAAASLPMIQDLAAEGVGLVLLGRQNSVETYRSFIAAGARDYLVLPLADGTEVALGLDETPTLATPKVASARTIGICGVSGGVGASVLAANLAVGYLGHARSGKLARDSVGSVALVDADLCFGSLAIDFDMDITPGLLEALLAPERVDRTFLNATMATPLAGLAVYSAEASEHSRIRALEAGFPALLQQIKADYPTLIVDLPRTLLAETPTIAEGLDELVLVLGQGFTSIRSCSRLLHRIADQTNGPRISCVLSQTRRDAGLRKSEITTALDRDIDMVLPQCGSELARASVKGIPLQKLAPRNGYSRSVSQLVSRLETPLFNPTDTKRSIWRWKKAGGHD
ncbi:MULTISPECIES: AAA family ATPase [Roseobacteraceae]|uniref:CpaE_hom_Actino: helicase/secretion neighborhood CpaE-like protein n=1 Tax=Pseudosulfitobacter pseudonitzschiae TaxID=1402135 RepID=A0A221K7H3_9RHOB|nr:MULTISPECIES: hypothetical protein [Roseobacteraceae]ASM74926.1 CpaE_hom_Actino: helicase/secretion neighborhood CpaE-like protein [Pseudosulfitobacter pseudonitzschiae]